MSEKSLHRAVCDYLKYQYKDCMFNTDLSGVRLPIGVASQLKSLRSFRGFPDLAIYESDKEGHKALFIELKSEGTRLFKKDGQPSTPHISEQMSCLLELRMRGYKAEFAIGFESAKKLIDNYLNNK